jgi:hypothetical protein
VFFSCKEALRFALYEADGDTARVHVEPASDIPTVNRRLPADNKPWRTG